MKIASIFCVIFAVLMSSSNIIADPLHEWAKVGNKKKIEQYADMQKKQKKNINWDAKNEYGQTPLMIAALAGQDQIVIYLLEHEVDPAITDREGKTAFDHSKNDQIKAALIKRSNTKDGQTLLTQTIKNGDEKHFNALIAHQATDINKANAQGQSPLHVAILQDNKTEANKNIAKKLFGLCAIAVNAKDKQGNTPLHYAARQGNVDLMMQLAEAGAQANILNNDRKKPIQVIGNMTKTINANERAAIEVELKALEEHPVDVKRAKQHCKPAAGAAKDVKSGSETTKSRADTKKQERDALEYLDQHTGRTLLTQAACEGSLENVSKIVDMGARINAPDRNVDTPLITAIKCYEKPVNGINHLAVIDYLLKHDASILIHDKDGKNALHYAVEYENKPLVDILTASLAKNPNKAEIINAQDRNGDTPLHYAAATSSVDLVIMLLKHGANRDLTNKAGQYPRDVLGTKQTVSENNRNALKKPSTQKQIRELLGIKTIAQQAPAAAAAQKPSPKLHKINTRTMSALPIISEGGEADVPPKNRARTVSVMVKPMDSSSQVTVKPADEKAAKDGWGKPGILTFDEETGDTHIEVPALDDESDTDH